MIRRISTLVLLAVMAVSLSASAHEMSKHAASTVVGEVVDTGCYLGHAAHGASHASCAARCIEGGMPMGLLTSQGAMYLLTMNHDNPDPYNKLKAMAGRNVAVTGAVLTRGGVKGIDVASI